MFIVEQDEDFINHETVLPDVVRDHNDADGPGPNPDDLHFDMRYGPESTWNTGVIDILLDKLRIRKIEEGWLLPERSDDYFKYLLKEKYKRVRVAWKAAQPRKTAMDIDESPGEVETRMLEKKETNLKYQRTKRRREAVSANPFSREIVY